jgi:SAM-dependent methyltransferase
MGLALWTGGENTVSTDPERIDAAIADLREAVEHQLGPEELEAVDVPREQLVRFSEHVADHLEPAERRRLAAAAAELGPWLQGPFLLGGDLVVGGTWRTDLRWELLGEHLPDDFAGSSVLDVGSNAGYDPFMFHLRGAARVVGCEPFVFIRQAEFLESIYQTGVEMRPISWQQLDPEVHGTFDVVHCHGVLYHELNPVALLQRLYTMLKPGGTLVFGTMMLDDPERSEYARLVPGEYFGDPTWWWVPGRLATRWMLAAAGFDIEEEFGIGEGPRGEFPVVNGYFRARRGTPPVHAPLPW